MIQPVRGRTPQMGYFLRGAAQFTRPRTLDAIARFVMGIVFAAYDHSVANIQQAIADGPSASAMRSFLRSSQLTAKLARLLDWKTAQLVRKALRSQKKRAGTIILAIDSTFKSTLSRLAHHLFYRGRGKRSANHIFVFGVLVFPDGRRLPLRPRQKKRGKAAPTQVDLAIELVRSLARLLQGRDLVVVADSYFFARKLLRTVKACGFHYVVACKENTTLADGRHMDSLLRTIRFRSSRVTLPSVRGERPQRFSVALRHLSLRCGGRQAVVFSRRYKKRGARVKVLVSDLMEATAAEIARLYALRWQVEVFFREAKMYLGLDEYRVRGEDAPANFAMLVTLAYQFLHWHGELGQRAPGTLPRLRELANVLTADNITTIERAALTRHRRKKIHRHFRRLERPSAHASPRVNEPPRRHRTAS